MTKHHLKEKLKYGFKRIVRRKKKVNPPICPDFVSKYNDSKFDPACALADKCKNADLRLSDNFAYCSGGCLEDQVRYRMQQMGIKH